MAKMFAHVQSVYEHQACCIYRRSEVIPAVPAIYHINYFIVSNNDAGTGTQRQAGREGNAVKVEDGKSNECRWDQKNRHTTHTPNLFCILSRIQSHQEPSCVVLILILSLSDKVP